MTGTILNAAGIVLGGVLGLALRQPLAADVQKALKGLIGLLVIFVGLRLTWIHLGPGLGLGIKQLTIVILAMMLGKLTGRLLHWQKGLNRLGRLAKEKIEQAGRQEPVRWSDGFVTCTILFCVAPMAMLGAVLDGLDGRWETLALKALVDGLATMAFVKMFGASAVLAVVPVVAFQGTIALAARVLAPRLQEAGMIESVQATSGLLVFCIALIVLELKKVELADYLPSLAWAPLLTWWLR